MRHSILEKLQRELDGGVDTEPKALYILAEIRKYIDGYDEEDKDKYPNLYFYCDWVLHIQMDRAPTKTLLNRFESLFSSISDLKEISRLFKEKEKDFYELVDLREELRYFLKKNGLPIELVENGKRWFEFKKLLTEILLDCPLVKNNGRVNKFAYERGGDTQTRFRIKIYRLGSIKITLKEK